MAGKPGVTGGRPVVVAVRLSEREAQALDQARGGVSRGVWLRWMLHRAVGQNDNRPT